MRFESLFFKENLNKKHEKYQFSLAGFFALLSFGLIAGLYKDDNFRPKTRRLARVIGRAANGLNNMDTLDVIIAGLTALAVGFLTILILDLMFHDRKIIVAFEINQLNKTIIFETKTVRNKKAVKTELQYNDLSFSHDKLKDGVTHEVFDCLIFKKNLKSIGILYLNHPMWNGYDSIEFDKSINLLKNQIR
ncbi:MAG: hypothetical protein VX772_05665 [Bacteroidota bacterium]|uniref:YcxB-like protein domain-containing protein n=1 Tax=Flagellimonas okinawensis TaxID=3031324 RepID=A0ABT5XJJ1_9FLAO|nr:hypothetical protein [[Muricauda] okinawensis]MDF0706060.1 hypothetical protein [[Muricauda] okinawensis]MEC8831825.1 hypothetical protein [Bacteroidota bacterium]